VQSNRASIVIAAAVLAASLAAFALINTNIASGSDDWTEYNCRSEHPIHQLHTFDTRCAVAADVSMKISSRFSVVARYRGPHSMFFIGAHDQGGNLWKCVWDPATPDKHKVYWICTAKS